MLPNKQLERLKKTTKALISPLTAQPWPCAGEQKSVKQGGECSRASALVETLSYSCTDLKEKCLFTPDEGDEERQAKLVPCSSASG